MKKKNKEKKETMQATNGKKYQGCDVLKKSPFMNNFLLLLQIKVYFKYWELTKNNAWLTLVFCQLPLVG